MTNRIITINKTVKNISKELKINHCMVLSIIWAESTFKSYQISFKGANGLMQVMPLTKNAMVLKLDYDLNRIITSNLQYGLNHYEIENIVIGSFYFKKLLKKFKGNYKKALVAYNSGSTYVYNNDISNHKYQKKVLKKFNYITSN